MSFENLRNISNINGILNIFCHDLLFALAVFKTIFRKFLSSTLRNYAEDIPFAVRNLGSSSRSLLVNVVSFPFASQPPWAMYILFCKRHSLYSLSGGREGYFATYMRFYQRYSHVHFDNVTMINQLSQKCA